MSFFKIYELQLTFIEKKLIILVDNNTTGDTEKSKNKMKAFEDLDVLGETLLKENLSSVSSKTIPNFNK